MVKKILRSDYQKNGIVVTRIAKSFKKCGNCKNTVTITNFYVSVYTVYTVN